MSAQTVDRLTSQFREIESLPSGSVFQLSLTDADVSSALAEYLEMYKTDIQNMIQQAIGVRLDLSDPKVRFNDNDVTMSVRVGKGIAKITASVYGTIVWNGDSLRVDVRSIDIPIVSVDPATVNSFIQGPIDSWVEYFKQSYEIRAFRIEKGAAILEAAKK